MIDHSKVSKYSGQILEVIDNQDSYTRGDLQGAIEAIVINIIADIENEA